MKRVLHQVRRHPWHGVSHDADGRRAHVTVDRRDPGHDGVRRDVRAVHLPRAHRARSGRPCAATGRRCSVMVAEAEGGGTNAGPVRAYSEGLDAAVACHDYPQLFDMTAAPRTRLRQYQRALTRRTASHPVHLRARSRSASTPAPTGRSSTGAPGGRGAAADNPARPPRPAGGHYSRVPTLVLSGELDSITTAAEGAIVARQFPRVEADRRRQQLPRRRPSATPTTAPCGILRRFVRTPSAVAAATRVRRRCRRSARSAASRGCWAPCRPARGPRLAARASGRARRRGDRGRPARPLVEQLLRARRRAARRALDLHRRPHHGLPPARRTPHRRPRGQRHARPGSGTPTG